MFCRKCGMKLEDGTKFCIACGAKVEGNQDAGKPQKSKRGDSRKKGLIIGLVIAVCVLGLGAAATATALIVSNRALDKKYVEVAERIDAFQMPDYIEQMNDISSGWDNSGLLDYKDKKSWIEELEKIAKEAEEASAELDEIEVDLKELEEKKERYRLADSFSEYEQILKNCGAAIQSRDLTKATSLLKDAGNVLDGVIKDNQEYINDKLEWYQNVDITTADANDVSAYNANIDKISQLVNNGEFNAVQEVFKVLDPIAYQYITPEKELDVRVQQLDLTTYPKVKLYVNLKKKGSQETPTDLEQSLFYVRKENANRKYISQKVTRVTQLNEQEALKINMVADVSGSMGGEPLYEAKNIMTNFIDSVQFSAGDEVELTSFSTVVNVEQEFTGDRSALINGIEALQTGGETYLYNALCASVIRVAAQSGAKCVIAFTDGMDNENVYKKEDVVAIAQRYHVPVFIIGIGNYEYSDLEYIAKETGGHFFDRDSIGDMRNIYSDIYRQEKELYMVEFQDDSDGLSSDAVNVIVGYHSDIYGGECAYSYKPNVLLSVSGESLYKKGPEKTVEGYLKAFAPAMTHSDFLLIEPYLKKGSNIYTTQKKYVTNDIAEDLKFYEITPAVYSDNENCVVATRETFYVYKPDEPRQLMTQECKYKVTLDGGTWKMTDFVGDINVVSRINQ